ncbi:ABC transporter substrate-binding protein [Cerasicoccus fimbriatus]|uniref:ABC transporter substrate-binding protein n=1 Tax=Cerasicoccus fimbriatus TaxID=3014554 RepID=UPI0022B45904|nr:ABC transporter substrate-binding protein [Cerasicoccus sp. TK19100]
MLTKTSLLAGCLALALALAGCGGDKSNSARETPKTFILARGSDAQKLDPADVDDGESVNALAQICEGLLRFKPGTLELEPWLAESFESSEDGLSHTFKLREGVQFHDGTPLTAETAAFSFRRQLDPSHPAHLATASFVYWNYLYNDIEAVEVVDPMTLRFRLKQPNATILYSLAIFPAWLISPNTPPAEIPSKPVGTGPYVFDHWEKDQAISLRRNEEYWAYPPHFDRVVLNTIPENTVRRLALTSGAVSAIDGVQPAEAETVAQDPLFKLYRGPSMNVGYLAIQTENPKFADPEIRRALAMAIDREALVKLALDGAALPASYPIPPGFLGEPKGEDPPFTYDPAAAKAILTQYPEFTQEPIVLSTLSDSRPYFPDPQRVASLIRSDWEAIGLQVEIETRDFKSHLQTLRNGDYECGLIGWIGDNGDPDNFLATFFHSRAAVKGSATNFAFYQNPKMDELLDEARRVSNTAERAKLYNAALAEWSRDLPIIPLVHAEQMVLMRAEFTGFTLSPTGNIFLGPVKAK